MRVKVSFRDPELLDSTFQELTDRFIESWKACHLCDPPYICPLHRRELREVRDDLTALTLGMMDLNEG